MINKFRFYLTYADIIGEFADDEAGQFIKKMCRFMFADELLDDKATDKVGSILMLISEELAEQKKENAPVRKNKSFAFLKVYANIFYSLKFGITQNDVKRSIADNSNAISYVLHSFYIIVSVLDIALYVHQTFNHILSNGFV